MNYKVADILCSPAPGKRKIKGAIAGLTDRFLYERILSREAWEVVYKEAEDAFRNKLDDISGAVGMWQGEFWGKWIIGAVRTCEYYEDSGLREFIRNGIHNLISLQEPDGYLGTYRNRNLVLSASPEVATAAIGRPCDWNWNIWCRKYTLWGLLEGYRLLGEKDILDAAEKLASQTIDQLHSQNISIADTGTFHGMPSGSILKPMLILYRYAGRKKYLDFSLEIASNWERMDNRLPNFIVNARTGKPVGQWFDPEKHQAKAYELLSCLDGLLELYRITGQIKYFSTVAAMHELLWEHDRNIFFSVGYNDILADAPAHLNAISEPCDAIHWMRLNSELFALTADKKYMDIFERTFCNAFLASIFRNGKWGARGVRSSGHHLAVRGQAGMKHNHCCVNNIPRGIMDMARCAVMDRGDTLYVSLYTDFSAEFSRPSGPVSVQISGTYLKNGCVEVRIIAFETIRLCLRIPDWSRTCAAVLNGRNLPSENGGFTAVAEPGETKIELTFDNAPVIHEYHGEMPDLRPDNWYVQRWIESTDMEISDMMAVQKAVITAGPLLLARSKFIGNTEAEMFAKQTIQGSHPSCKLMPTDGDALAVFQARITGYNLDLNAKVCDFASAANEMITDRKFFSIFF